MTLKNNEMKQTTPQQAIEAKAASIQLIKKTQRASKEYQNEMFYMDESTRGLSQYIAKKKILNSFKTSLN